MADSGDALSDELHNLAVIASQDQLYINSVKDGNTGVSSATPSLDSTLFDIDDDYHAPTVPQSMLPTTKLNSTQPSETTTSTRSAVQKKRFVGVQIPDEILYNGELNKAIERLPKNYSFEIHKTLWRIKTADAKMVALQFPEGLLMYAVTISDILERFAGVETLIMGDVTYGACCIDDFTARALGCDFMVHYGHSCLVPINVAQMNTLYVFVDILFTVNHLVHMMKENFAREDRIVLAGTIQFANALHAAKRSLEKEFPNILIPQCKPLSQGEILGCTSPHLPTMIADEKASKARILARTSAKNEDLASNASINSTCCGKNTNNMHNSSPCACSSTSSTSTANSSCSSSPSSCSSNTTADTVESGFALFSDPSVEDPDSVYDICIFIADGRFHLESMMIHNPQITRFYKYDPYNKMMTHEAYDVLNMHTVRAAAITKAKEARKWGVALGTLGRQGSTQLMDRVVNILKARGLDYTVVLLSEIFPSKLAMFEGVDAWVQIACPRLSIDWGHAFSAPLLSTYEFDVVMGLAPWLPKGIYPMDFYSHLGGAWTNYHEKRQEVKRKAALAASSSDKTGRSVGKGLLRHRMKKMQVLEEAKESEAVESEKPKEAVLTFRGDIQVEE